MKLQKRLCLSFIAMIIAVNVSHAQVLIGSAGTIENFIALKVVAPQKDGGLRYPQLSETQKKDLTTTINNNPLAFGLTIFNTENSGCMEYYRMSSDGSTGEWMNLCDPANPTKRFASLVGFRGDNIVNVADLESQKYIKEYKLILGNTGTTSLLRIGKYLDYENVIKSVTIDTGNLSNENKVIVEFYPKSLELLSTKPKITARLFAVYSEGGEEKQTEFRLEMVNKEPDNNSSKE